MYSEVEKRITKFRAQLKKEVQELPSPLTRQKTLIRYLLGLGDSRDPAWDCLIHQHHWIQESMSTCKENHLKKGKLFQTVFKRCCLYFCSSPIFGLHNRFHFRTVFAEIKINFFEVKLAIDFRKFSQDFRLFAAKTTRST